MGHGRARSVKAGVRALLPVSASATELGCSFPLVPGPAGGPGRQV